MRIFIFTTAFAPSIGGIERLTELLATQFVRFGHEVILATTTAGHEGHTWPFQVMRQPTTRQFLSLLKWCDVHFQANLSLKHLHPLIVRKPFVVHHGTWYNRSTGRRGFRDYLKLVCARTVHGIAASRYIAKKIGCGEVIGNPYDDSVFRVTAPLDERDRDVVFVGRLVSEKGCDTLIEALSMLRERNLAPSCTLVGDGPERGRLAEMVREVDLDGAVRFLGALHGSAIADELNRHRIMVVPSRCQEAFGIVALEGLACGCLLIVSAEGGLIDAIGEHGLTFRNGDPIDLADRLELALRDGEIARRKLRGVEQHLAGFTARSIAERYVEVFERVLAGAT